jgi:hypothetical protein
MKKIQLQHFFIVLAVIASAFIVSCNKDSEEPVLDFDLTVPDNWTYLVQANEGWIYTAGRNPVDENDTITEGIYIFKYTLEGYSFASYYAAFRPELIASETFVSLLHETDTIINGTDFMKLVSTEIEIFENSGGDQDTVDVITERYIFFENNAGYEFLLFSPDTLYYNQNHAIFDDIMGSFHYKE